MANEVKIKITAESTVKPVLAGVQDGLHDVETAADKAGNELKGVDKELAAMDRQVAASRNELKRLAMEFRNVDDEAQKMDIKRAMDRVRKEISEATKVQKALKFSDIIPDEPDPAATSKFSKGMSKIATIAGANVGPVLASSVGVAAAPLIGAMIGAAVIGGVGIGGVAGGMALAAKDARVQSAAKAMGDQLQDRLQDSVKFFVPEMIQGMQTIKAHIDDIHLEKIFKDASKMVDPLAEGVGRFLEGIGSGIEDAMANAQETVEAIADGIGDLGETLGEGMSSLADNGDDAADAMNTLFETVDLAASAAFGLINGLTEIYGWLKDIGALGEANPMTWLMDLSWLDDAINGSEELVGVWHDGANAASDFQQAAKDLSDELKAQSDPVFGLMKAQEDLEESQKKVNKATKKFGEDSPQAQEALRELAKNALATQAAAGKLGDTFDGKLTPEMRSTMQAAGMTKGEIARLERQFMDAKRKGESFSKTYNAKVIANTGSAMRNINGVQAALDDIPRSIGIAMRITNVSSVSKAAASIRKQYQAHGGIVGSAATGGIRHGLTLVGEHGPELAEIAPGGRVWSGPDTSRLMGENWMNQPGKSAGPWKGGAPGLYPTRPTPKNYTPVNQPIVVRVVMDGKVLAEAMADPTREFVRSQFGGSVQDAFGRVG